MSADTLDTLLARVEDKPAVRKFSTREGKLAQLIQDGIPAVDPSAPTMTKVTNSTATGATNNLALPAGGVVVFTHATAPTLSGIAAGAEGQVLTIVNGSAASNLTILSSSGLSSAANQITVPGLALSGQVDGGAGAATAASAVLLPGQAVQLVYAAAKWRTISPAVATVTVSGGG